VVGKAGSYENREGSIKEAEIRFGGGFMLKGRENRGSIGREEKEQRAGGSCL